MEKMENLFTDESFESLLSEYQENSQELREGALAKGVIVEITPKAVTIDIGGKSVGYVALAEFGDREINIGDIIDVFVNRLENKRGELLLSVQNAVRFATWSYLKDCLEDETIIEGSITGRVKGGFAVDINSIVAFLPRSQVDTAVLANMDNFVGKTEQFRVLKIDDIRGNVVVSRKAILDEERSKEREEILAKINIGDVLDGIVKNITDYGAFIDFGSFDGLLHLTDISWCRVRHPSEVLELGQPVRVQVIKFDQDSKRVSLGMKQLLENPWTTIENKYPVGTIVQGHVKNIAQYGAFVEIENGIEGLVHVSEMSWLKNNVSPSKFLSIGQEVEVMILDIDAEHHRISLGIKQCEKNPWQDFSEAHKVGDVIKGKIKNITEFGVFVGLEDKVDGLVHVSDIAWEGNPEELLKNYSKGQEIDVVLLGTNYEKERITLGIKQLDKDLEAEMDKLEPKAKFSCVVKNVKKDFVELELESGLKGTINKRDFKGSKGRKFESLAEGDILDAYVSSFNRNTGKLTLSLEEEGENSYNKKEEKVDLSKYSDNTETTLGSILGDVLQESQALFEKK